MGPPVNVRVVVRMYSSLYNLTSSLFPLIFFQSREQSTLRLFCFRLYFYYSLYVGLKSPANGNWSAPCRADFELFNATFPRPTRSSSIGNGVQFLNRHLSSIMFRNTDCLEPLLDFLRAHKHKGHVSLSFFVTRAFVTIGLVYMLLVLFIWNVSCEWN
ncbi:hypothetical protein Syun_003966 [Stephania yunnanensis]|uniref:sucrose synthase n=1 Tax=Stephania yunnanensis TaxID=152371 RepID=A0AAP0L640_9MAGN